MSVYDVLAFLDSGCRTKDVQPRPIGLDWDASSSGAKRLHHHPTEVVAPTLRPRIATRIAHMTCNLCSSELRPISPSSSPGALEKTTVWLPLTSLVQRHAASDHYGSESEDMNYRLRHSVAGWKETGDFRRQGKKQECVRWPPASKPRRHWRQD